MSESRSFAVTAPPHISLLFDVILTRRPFQAAYYSLWLVHCCSVSGLPDVTSKSNDAAKKDFSSGRMASGDLFLIGHTDNCKINIMIVSYPIMYDIVTALSS